MAWCFLSELYNSFTQIGINYFNSLFLQEFIQVTFFGKHGFALHNFLNVVCTDDVKNNIVMLFPIGSPMNSNSICSSLFFKLNKIIIQIGESVIFNLRSPFPQKFPFSYAMSSFISFFPDKPQGFIMPVCAGLVLYKC